MPPASLSPEGLAIMTIFSIYIGIRLESLDQIWSELDEYKKTIQENYLDYLIDSIFEPFADELDSRLDEVFSEHATESDSQNGDDGSTGIGEVEDFEEFRESAEEAAPDWEDFGDRYSNPGAIFPDLIETSLDMVGIEPNHPEQMPESPITAFAIDRELLDSEDIFNNTRKFYRKDRWPIRIFSVIQASMVSIILLTALSIVFTVMNNGFAGYLPRLAIIASIIWGSSELCLWYVLNMEVDMEDRTPVGKFLRPDPREFF